MDLDEQRIRSCGGRSPFFPLVTLNVRPIVKQITRWNKPKLTQFGSIAAVYVKRLVAFVDFSDACIEHETVRAESFFGDAVATFVKFVALYLILILSVFVVRAFVVLGV